MLVVWMKYVAIDPASVAVAVLPSKPVTTARFTTASASNDMPTPSYGKLVQGVGSCRHGVIGVVTEVDGACGDVSSASWEIYLWQV
jgi:hypothetical protein